MWDPDANANGHCNRDSYRRDFDADAYRNRNAYCDGHSDRDCDGNTDCDGNSNGYSDCDCDGHCNHNAYCDGNSNGYSDRDADPNRRCNRDS